MSHAAQDLAIACIPGSQSLVSDPAPVKLGRKRRYFKDWEVKASLGLSKGDFLQADGTYGSKELTDSPINFFWLQEGTYDRCLLPFVSEWQGTLRRLFIDLHTTNRQWMPPKHSTKVLWSELDKLCWEAEMIALQTTLPIPEYAFNTLPLICFQPTDMTEPFKFQFQLWFDPKAHQA